MSDKELTDIPEEVKELQKNLGELNRYHKLALSATFTGAQSKDAAKLVEFLYDLYKQTLAQFDNHPYVVNARKEAQE